MIKRSSPFLGATFVPHGTLDILAKMTFAMRKTAFTRADISAGKWN
jgi:hypothetical protein